MNFQERLQFFQELTSCCSNLYFWTYDPEMSLLSSNCENSSILDDIFSICGCRDFLQDYIKENDMPLILNDYHGILWVAVFEKKEGAIVFIHVMGPVFVNETALPTLMKNMNQRELSIKAKRKTIEIFNTIPLIYSNNLFQYAQMFHYCVTNEKIAISQIQHQLHTSDRAGHDPQDSEHSLEDKLHLGTWEIEQQLQAMIKEGNINYESVLAKAASISFGVKMKTGDSLRRGKNSVIIFVSMSSRAAIAGGLPAPIAYNLCDFYTDLAESCRTLSELATLSKTMYDDFIHRVRDYQKDSHISKQIQTCCDYIQMNILEKISIQELAKLSGYTEYYLSRKFKKETGFTPNEYINIYKIKHAKLLLTSTAQSIQEISDTLNYCSSSYFSSVFQEHTGCSPSVYRETHHTS